MISKTTIGAIGRHIYIYIYIEVRGRPEQDIESLGMMGLGAGSRREVPLAPTSPQTKKNNKWVLVNCNILYFLTHMRDLDVLLVAIDS